MITKFNLSLNKIIKKKYPFKLLRRNRHRKKYKMKKLEMLSLEFILINIRKRGEREISLFLPHYSKNTEVPPILPTCTPYRSILVSPQAFCSKHRIIHTGRRNGQPLFCISCFLYITCNIIISNSTCRETTRNAGCRHFCIVYTRQDS